MSNNLVGGLWAGHDCAYCILDEKGMPLIHAELERYNREKSPNGDVVEFMMHRSKDLYDRCGTFGIPYPVKKIKSYKESFANLESHVKSLGGDIHFFSHHYCHAANAFYSSNFEDSIVLTMDGGGSENEAGGETCCTVWRGSGNQLYPLKIFTPSEVNIGGVWSRITRYVFGLQNGWPRGGQEGTVMAMAALGDPSKYYDDFLKMLTVDKMSAGFKPPNQPKGARIPGKDPVHPYLDKWFQIAQSSDQETYNLAASLQLATESLIESILKFAHQSAGSETTNLCLSGGVTLNSVAMGKINKWMPGAFSSIYIPPVPYDAGLAIGAAQIVTHGIQGKPRVKWDTNFPSYLGEVWKKEFVNEAIQTAVEKNPHILAETATDEEVVDMLDDQKIVAVFNGKSESGRRALGNRSILADPRSVRMKDDINKKVKHRQWYRPFAPSVLEEDGKEWFDNFIESPYMQFVLPIKEDKKEKVPAIVHFDGSARLQTINENHNPWYYRFLKIWKSKTGVPILLNTSFNDREPICETPVHAINCFLGTDIDCLYFPEVGKVLKKDSE